MKTDSDDNSHHIFGWILGGPIFLLDILIRKLSWKLWDKAYSDSGNFNLFIRLYDMMRRPKDVMDHLTDRIILPRLNFWTIIP